MSSVNNIFISHVMSMSFRDNFESFRKEFSKERSLVVAALSINMKAVQDMLKEYSDLLTVNALLTRLHYIAHARRSFTLEELKLPMKGIQQLSLAASLRLFVKPNHKDRYAILIHYLHEKPDLFAQILYFALLTPSNPSIELKDVHLFTEDDALYFCFSTFPSMFNYFMTDKDQMMAIELIEKLFRLHLSLHGPNFAKPHQFLSHLVTAFFLSTNPGTFFDSLKPFMREFMQKSTEAKFEYEKRNQNSLLRSRYWHMCVNFAVLLVERMKKSVALMPTAARYLITRLSEIDAKGFPFMELFVFDAMICDYLENHLTWPEATIMRDACNVMRCRYPQDIIPSSCYAIVSQSKFLETVQIYQLMDALKLKGSDEQPLSFAVKQCEEMALYAARDLALLFHSVALFMKFGDEDKLSELNNKFSGLALPTSESDDQFIQLKNWGSEGVKTKVDSKPPREFDDIIDSLSTIDCPTMQYGTPDQLADLALLYCSESLGWMERLRVDQTRKISARIPEALKAIRTYKNDLNVQSRSLFTALFSITTERERNTGQAMNLLELLMRKKVVPTMHELFPKDFDFSSWDMLAAKQTVERVHRAIETHVKSMELPEAHCALLEKTIMLMYIDQLDRMFDSQAAVKYADNLKNLLVQYDRSFDVESLHLTKFQLGIVKKASTLFSHIDKGSPPSQNLECALIAINLLKDFTDDVIKKAIAQANNPSDYAFLVFIQMYLTDDKMKRMILSPEEQQLMARLVKIGLQLRKEVSP